MFDSPFALPDGRLLWGQGAMGLWAKVVENGSSHPAERPAIAAGVDPDIDSLLRVNARPNAHYLWQCGPGLLIGGASEYAERVRQTCDLPRTPGWRAFRGWVEDLCVANFADPSSRLPDVGWVSLTGIRAASARRSVENAAVAVVPHAAASVGRFATPREFLDRKHVQVREGIRFPTDGLEWAVPDGVRNPEVYKVVVKRSVRSEAYGIDRAYNETWFCFGTPDYVKTMERGGVPAANARSKPGAGGRLRRSAMLNLIKVRAAHGHLLAGDAAGPLTFMHLGVEIEHGTGQVLSLRTSTMPLDAAMACSCPVEGAAVAQHLGRHV